MQSGPMVLLKRFLVVGCAVASLCSAPAQEAPDKASSVIKTEKRLVLVDTVVTDKKGDYLHDLTAKDFRVWEDKKEQSIESFSFEADPKSPLNTQKHYMVLFFDNSTMQFSEQIYARRAAINFIDSNGGANRLIAVANFGGALQIAQNFTEDKERLRQVVNGVKFSSVSPNGDVALAGLGKAAADFGARDVLLALRNLAKGLGGVPGRKTLVFLSSGFSLDSELRSELTSVIDVCNKANVAIYPIDVRGLVAVSFNPPVSYLLPVAFVQQRGGAGTASGGGGARGGGAAPGRSGSAGTPGAGRSNPGNFGNPGMNRSNNPFNQPRSIVPALPNVTKNQDVLYALAQGTGGFVIANTNDLLGGLQRIGSEQNEYYVLGYSPTEAKEGSCHELKVKVERGGTNVRARSGYCTAKPLDLLAGSPVEKDLESRASGAVRGNVGASMEAPFFYTSPNTARVNVAMDIAPTGLQFEKQKGKLHSEMNVLGIAYAPEGDVAARFSDTVKFDFENKKELEQFQTQPYHYETQFDIGSGKYDLKVVFSSGGQGFGKLQMPLVVDPYDSKKFGLSSVALSKDIHRVSDLDVGLDAVLLEDRKPLVSQGMQITPSGSNLFKKTDIAAVYVEIYEPLLLQPNSPKVGLQMRLVDRKSGDQKVDTGFINMASYSRAGSPVIPVGLKLPVSTLTPGLYRAEFKAMDEAGNSSVIRTADFEVQ